ncbi:MAG: hypothetical protein ACC662_05860, partial [Planctomycetota bacterium]
MRRTLGLGLVVLVGVGTIVFLVTKGPSGPASPEPAPLAPPEAGPVSVPRLRSEPPPAPPSIPREKPGSERAGTVEPPTPEPEPRRLAKARAALERLEKLLRNQNAANEELLAALDEVWRWYQDPRERAPVVLHAMPKAGHPDAHVVAEANFRMLTQPEDTAARTPEDRRFWAQVRSFRRQVRKALLRALALT